MKTNHKANRAKMTEKELRRLSERLWLELRPKVSKGMFYAEFGHLCDSLGLVRGSDGAILQ